MNCFRLRSYEMGQPGGFPYDQPGAKPRRFTTQPLIEATARIVLAYRKGNGLERATLKECIEDIDRFQCARMGNNPRFCVQCNQDNPSEISMASNAPGLVPCKGCGAPVTA